jgi:hypothetical protein
LLTIKQYIQALSLNGNPTNSPGLRLQLSDFAPKEPSEEMLGKEDGDITPKTRRLILVIVDIQL